ncbi:MAG: hypothetical protein ABL999_09125 [Pyrinomonadaceae bacterium]
MNISRRKFLGAATTSTAIALVLDKGILGQVQIMPPLGDGGALGRMNFLSFFENMNTEFLFLNKDRIQVPLRLVAVDDVRPLSKQQWGKGQENFVLKFHGPAGYPMKQGTHEVEHFALGKFGLFITEGRSDKSGNTFVAVINRVDSAGE